MLSSYILQGQGTKNIPLKKQTLFPSGLKTVRLGENVGTKLKSIKNKSPAQKPHSTDCKERNTFPRAPADFCRQIQKCLKEYLDQALFRRCAGGVLFQTVKFLKVGF